ncbi:uncharacterized protein EI97DRAFT_215015 [Westerdykella ornata]|uniref:Uncharacterized protein n=1 Tax=Westerdykella ornata TaxID=318751 RepID=A0A6A6JU96_WESOR|nr:uncharacterized protein EI97DRAFT_215015 [Westerdykella ornata]KAF2278609.1 hypothetical protein EI97DRAFT_215015 [Westerdykella ornata]
MAAYVVQSLAAWPGLRRADGLSWRRGAGTSAECAFLGCESQVGHRVICIFRGRRKYNWVEFLSYVQWKCLSTKWNLRMPQRQGADKHKKIMAKKRNRNEYQHVVTLKNLETVCQPVPYTKITIPC